MFHLQRTTAPPGPSRIRGRGSVASVPTVLLAFLVCGAATGCRTGLDMSAFRAKDDDEIARMASTEGVKGPLERLVGGRSKDVEMHRLRPIEGEAELEEARKLFDAGEYAKAERQLKRIAKRYEDSPVEEDALFLIAESKFHRGYYPKAQDQYNLLLKEYPSSRYLETSTRRLFDIGREWLDFPKPVETNEIAQVNFENPSHTPPPKANGEKSLDPSKRYGLVPNLFDRRRPYFDRKGRGLESMRAIWLNDPTGPLADDALMLTASHHLREGNYRQADYLFTLLREEYPRSPHLEKAFVLGSHVKLMSYQGAIYDGTALDESKTLKESTLRIFPETETRERIREEIGRLAQADVEREWQDLKFWQRKGNDGAVAMQARELIRLYPDSEYADRARQILRELPAEAVQLATPLRPVPKPSLLQRITPPNLMRVPGTGGDDEDESEGLEDPFGGEDTPPATAPEQPRTLDPGLPESPPIAGGRSGRVRLTSE